MKVFKEKWVLPLDKTELICYNFIIANAPLGVQAGVAAGIFTIAVNTGPLPDQVLWDEGANLLFPSMPAFNENWEILKQELKNK